MNNVVKITSAGGAKELLELHGAAAEAAGHVVGLHVRDVGADTGADGRVAVVVEGDDQAMNHPFVGRYIAGIARARGLADVRVGEPRIVAPAGATRAERAQHARAAARVAGVSPTHPRARAAREEAAAIERRILARRVAASELTELAAAT